METRPRRRNAAERLMNAFDPPLGHEARLHLEVTLHAAVHKETPQIHVALRVGTDRLYVVNALGAFLEAVRGGERVGFGKGFTLDPQEMRFERIDQKVLDVLWEVESAKRLADSPFTMPRTKFYALPDAHARRLLFLLMAKPFRLARAGRLIRVDRVFTEPLPMLFELIDRAEGLAMKARLPDGLLPLTEDCRFVVTADGVFRVRGHQRSVVRSLWPELHALRQKAAQDINAPPLPGEWDDDQQSLRPAGDQRVELRFPPQDIERVISELLPQLELAGHVRIQPRLEKRLTRKPLQAQVYLDRDRLDVTARVRFSYGDVKFDPFQSGHGPVMPGRPLVLREAAGERAVLDELSRAGFRVRAGQAYLSDAQQTLGFFFEGVHALMQRAEVFCSDRFTRMRPRTPTLTGRFTLGEGVLKFALLDDGNPIESSEDILGIMEALRDRRRYFRLKNGGFLDLRGFTEDWQRLADSIADVAASGAVRFTPRGEAEMAVYRALFYRRFLEEVSLPVEMDAQAGRLGDLPEEPLGAPASLCAQLRPYQLRGVTWLDSLYRMKMGGVLADDMGLGKTLQMITALLVAKEREGARRSLVIAPTSLLYNWEAEIKRFAPTLSCVIAEGSPLQRERLWQDLEQYDDTDVIITSYPLVRRDAEFIEKMDFRMVVLDEAQQIKNVHAQATAAVKRLRADARFALTGTPMENHPGELWSIFDFVLPGYLLTQGRFLAKHGAGQPPEALHKKIKPFLMRRLKHDVLPELPEKTEERILAEMTPEQKRVYQASLTRARMRVEQMEQQNTLQGGRVEVLSLLTEMRQICCHPLLCLEDYQGGSGKLEALLSILPGAIENGHRVLLFSQFTRMLRILERRFMAEGVECMYLDGQTPAKDRLASVERFNAGEGQLFLISLKAGGAGLNLTGADMVVHYDPWWNPAAEDQATDRAHRIGQEKTVHVVRLIARGTIEEQVDALRERKRALFEAIVTAGEVMPSSLSAEEIRGLFA